MSYHPPNKEVMERFVYFAENTTLHGWRYCVTSGRNLCHGVFWACTLCGCLMLSAWILSTDVRTFMDATVSYNLKTLAGNLDEVRSEFVPVFLLRRAYII